MTVRFVPVIAASLLLASAASAQNAGPAPAETAVSSAAPRAVEPSTRDTSKDYRIGPEDVLDIWVFGQDDLSRRIPVLPDGRISMPYVNDVVAAGKTPSELRDIIAQGLMKHEILTSPVVSVMVFEVRSARGTVTGSVRMPNSYDLRTGATVMEMIGKAQGFTEWAKKEDITLIRATNGERIKMKWNRLVDGKDPNLVMQAGDILVVGGRD
jgi:polysaccharide export outer membrane protein